jgi:hypothetical protein
MLKNSKSCLYVGLKDRFIVANLCHSDNANDKLDLVIVSKSRTTYRGSMRRIASSIKRLQGSTINTPKKSARIWREVLLYKRCVYSHATSSFAPTLYSSPFFLHSHNTHSIASLAPPKYTIETYDSLFN